MKSCTVMVLVCLLSVEAAPALRKEGNRGALKAGVKVLRKDIKTLLGYLEVPGQLPNISCLTQNYTELVVPDGQLFTGQHLSIFRCYMLNMSEPTSELSQRLKQTVQKLCSLELHVTKKLIDQDCILPPSQQDVDFNVKCVLKLLDQHLSRATFS